MDDLQKYGNLKRAIKNFEDKKKMKINLKSGKKIGYQQLHQKQKEKNKSSTRKATMQE